MKQPQWVNDNKLAAQLGDWWLEDFDISDATPAQSVEIANRALKARGLNPVMLDVRESDSMDNCDWLVQQ